MRYSVLNLLVLFICLTIVLVSYRKLFTKRWLVALLVLLTMTALFDSLIVYFGIVAYNPDHFLGIYIGKAPIEDFAYTIAGLMVVPYIWKRLKDR